MAVVFVLALIAAVILAAVFLPKAKKGSYTGFAKGLYEFLRFEKFWLPSLIRFIYLLVFCYAVIGGLYMMFAVNFLAGISLLVLTPLVFRLIVEGLFVLYSIREELVRMREHAEGKDKE
ncbi:hypothetical protein SDC9_182993 [bioreactor metagenome]|uniref:Uncharacterized protein n=1 Tax=bioreactor metagenome TaxID=1076179 RepID=A0A645H918_9ZZZZ